MGGGDKYNNFNEILEVFKEKIVKYFYKHNDCLVI